VEPTEARASGPGETDEGLVRLVAAGDRAAFGRLVGRHEAALQRFALRACGGPREAEDALQDGLLALWRGAAGFRADASARTWIFQLVVNACHRRHRRRSGEPARTEPVEAAVSLPGADPLPDERAGARELGTALDRALASLPEAAREVLLLRDVEGLSGEETARALGVGLAAMKSRLHRARLDLKKRVEAILGHPVEEVAS
jgi:RNA polymerase sigma-70 factor (ECF subfamily)